jgi:hypothetical protein
MKIRHIVSVPQRLALLQMALWAAAGLASAHALVVWLAPAPLVLAPAAGSAPAQTSALSQLFGVQSGSQATALAKDIRLIGVLAGSQQGAVLVSIGSGPARQLSLGRVEPDGWTLLELNQDQVVLGHQGNTVSLKVPRSRGF